METSISAAAGLPAGSGRDGLLELAVSDVAHGGWCVAREPGGRVVFVRHALPVERVGRLLGALFVRVVDALCDVTRLGVE